MNLSKFIITVLWLVASVVSASAIKRPTEIHFRHLREGRPVIMGELSSIKCHYDASGRLDTVHFVVIHILSGSPQIKDISGKSLGGQVPDTLIATLSWQENFVTVKGQAPWSHEAFQYTYVLDKGRATEQSGDTYTQKYFYNADGELTDVMYRYGREDVTVTSYLRSNGNVTKVNGNLNDFSRPYYRPFVNVWDGSESSKSINFYPGEHVNPVGIDFTLLETMPYSNQIMTLAGIDGKHSPNLPHASGWVDNTVEYIYEFDADGYPLKITVPSRIWDNQTDVVDLKYGVYPESRPDAVDGIYDSTSDFSVNGRTVIGSEGTLIRAYDLQGRQVASSDVGTVTLGAPGVYILRSGAKTMKVAIK